MLPLASPLEGEVGNALVAGWGAALAFEIRPEVAIGSMFIFA
jgi:hypothetical protein